MTSGDECGASGPEARRAGVVALLVFTALGFAFALVNAISELEERERLGHSVEPWEPWVWEFSSLIGFLLIAPVIIHFTQRLWPPVLSWPAAWAVFIPVSVAASLAHVAIMTGLREATYAVLGGEYRQAGAIADVLIYEYRKDLLTCALLVLLAHLATRIVEKVPARDLPAYRVEVRNGSRTLWLAPAEIDWAQAAGNYVELHGAFGSLLHRRTLAALEQELGPLGFVRIHRSRIVRHDAVTGVETRTSGDFDVILAGGAKLSGSRRYRTNLA